MEIYQERAEWNCWEKGHANTMADLAGIELSTEQISDYVLIRTSREDFFTRQSDQKLLHSLLDYEQQKLFCRYFDCIKFN